MAKKKASSAKPKAGKAAKKTAKKIAKKIVKKVTIKKAAKKKIVKKAVGKIKASKKKIANKAKSIKKKPVKKAGVPKRKALKKAAVKKRPIAKKQTAPKKKSTKHIPAPAKTISHHAKKSGVKTAKPAFKKVHRTAAPLQKAVTKPIEILISTPILETVELNHTSTEPVFVPHETSLREGLLAPYFEGLDQHGNLLRSSDFIGKSVILYFYPKDFTGGCTAEACSLRDEYQYLNDNNYVVIGVSADSVESHKRFAEELMLPFSIIADTDHTVINAYDVWGPKQLAGKIYDGIVRTTFIIDPDGVIKNIVSKVDSANHAQQLLSL